MKSRATNLIRLASVVSVAVGTLAGCSKTAVVEQPPLTNVPEGGKPREVSNPDFISLQPNGAVSVNAPAGATATVSTISLTPSRLTQANGFITAFSNFKHPRGLRLNKDGTNMYVVD